MKASSLLSLVLPALATLLPAQTPDHLVGITRATPALRHQSHAACTILNQCVLPGMPGSVGLPPFVGGTAWNPVRSGAWVSNGLLIGQYDDNCAIMCPPMAIPTLPAGAFVTGLEYVESLNQLWMIDSQGNLHFYSNTCPPNPLGVCNTGLLPTAVGNVTSGLAVDEAQGLVFISFPQFPGGLNRIVVTQIGAPCTPVANFLAPPCFAAFGPILGLACDWGKSILYATDGTSTIGMNYVWAPPMLNVVGITCCPPIAVNEPMIGLAIRPGRETSMGQPCANGPCPPCPQVHSLRNDPNLGNLAFTLGLDQAPAGAFSWMLLGNGPCLAPGVTIAPLCGPIYTLGYIGSLGAVPTGGGLFPCDGQASFNVPLPSAPALAGAVFSSQCLTLCFGGGGLGYGLSNCISWELQGN